MSSLLWGEMSTALGTEIPPNWSLVTSSRGAAFSRPSIRTWTGFLWVLAATMSNAWATVLYAFIFFPVYFSVLMMLLMSLSTMLSFDFPNHLLACFPPEWGTLVGVRSMYLASPPSLTTTSEVSYLPKMSAFCATISSAM